MLSANPLIEKKQSMFCSLKKNQKHSKNTAKPSQRKNKKALEYELITRRLIKEIPKLALRKLRYIKNA